jgi:hypothetical protein
MRWDDTGITRCQPVKPLQTPHLPCKTTTHAVPASAPLLSLPLITQHQGQYSNLVATHKPNQGAGVSSTSLRLA